MREQTLYLIRHGATAANLEGRYIGWEEHPLSPEGWEQARRAAAHLCGLELSGITGIVTSDLLRSVQTARVIQQAIGLPLRREPGLREVNFGRWSGLTYGEIEAREAERLQAWMADPEQNAPPDGESLAALRSRVLAALPRKSGAVVVTHGGVIRAVLAHLTGRPFWDFQVPPGSVTTLRVPSGPYGTIVPGQDGSPV